MTKAHKALLPFRPILAAYEYETAMYKIAKFVVPLIEPFAFNEYTKKKLLLVLQIIVKISCAKSIFVVSYDVTSLYTNVPVEESMQIVLE